ncbi:unnamed protein product [Oppiella nova]|uniref:Uncharacterized protein n=1 Tax=Oppiella nova TaxID=334625 RepID=A0A7R9MJ44_9ACAR|nr:unnamed protein product [Oppiella nova]CAG2178070.1 unnamed protein product [Oppiella nova]
MVTVCGLILREFLRFEDLEKEVFTQFTQKPTNGQKLYLNFLDFLIKSDSFAISSDVFATLRELFARHKTVAKKALQTDYEIFVPKFNQLLTKDDYYIRRKAIRLLSDLLYDRSHQTVMKRYVDSVDNLKIIKTLMDSDCLYVSFDAFLVFHAFVVHPNKSESVDKYMDQNKDRKDMKLYVQEKANMIRPLNGEPLTKEPSDPDHLNIIGKAIKHCIWRMHPFMHTYNYEKKGFADPPTDYYLRPYYLAMDSKTKEYCYLDRVELEVEVRRHTTDTAKYEERLPFMHIYVPQRYRSRNLTVNEHRLTTPFDIHSTLKHILEGKTNTTLKYGLSLLEEIPYNRSCDSIHILEDWCVCHISRRIHHLQQR